MPSRRLMLYYTHIYSTLVLITIIRIGTRNLLIAIRTQNAKITRRRLCYTANA